MANLHASFHTPKAATRDVERAAAKASEWAGGLPLIFGGDLNLRPRTSPAAFSDLDRGHGLDGTTGPGRHSTISCNAASLPRGAPQVLPAGWRETAIR